MIDEEMTVRIFGYTSDMLAWKSHKKIVVMCDECGVYRAVSKHAYRDLCYKCANPKVDRKKMLPVTNIQLKEEYESGLNTVELANKYNCSQFTITDRLCKIDCKIRDNKLILPLTDIELKEKYESGLTVYQLADECKCSIQPILKRLKETSCKIRSNSESHKGIIPSEETRKKMCESQKGIERPISNQTKEKLRIVALKRNEDIEARILNSCGQQGISRDDWNGFAKDNPYCYKFNESIREHIREKYDRKCFICGKPESENITTTGKQRKLSVHHVDRNKSQGCDGHDWVLVPLCLKHHGITHNELWTARIIWLLNNVW